MAFDHLSDDDLKLMSLKAEIFDLQTQHVHIKQQLEAKVAELNSEIRRRGLGGISDGKERS